TDLDVCRKVTESVGGCLDVLLDGSMAVTISGTAIATDQAATAARCALSLKALSPERPMFVSTVLGETTGRMPVGEVIDRAAKRFAAIERFEQNTSKSLLIAIEEMTAALLDSKFDIKDGQEGPWLCGEHDFFEGAKK